MSPEQQNPTFIEACKFVADNPYSNDKGQVRRFASLAELLSHSHLVIPKSASTNVTGRDFFTHADIVDSSYFSGRSESTRAIINEFIAENILNKVSIAGIIDFSKIKGEPSFLTCNLNWRISGFKKILQDTKDKFALLNVEVVQQPYSDQNKEEVLVDKTQYLLELENLEDIVDIGKAYYFIFTIKDLTTDEIKTFAYPIDFKAE